MLTSADDRLFEQIIIMAVKHKYMSCIICDSQKKYSACIINGKLYALFSGNPSEEALKWFNKVSEKINSLMEKECMAINMEMVRK